VALGEAAPILVHIAPTGTAYPGVVTFTAAGLPPGSSVSFSPSTLPADVGPKPVNAKVQTSPSALTAKRTSSSGASIAFGLFLIPLAGASRLRRGGHPMKSLWVAIVLLAGMTATAGLSGCGAGFAQKTYNIRITATSGAVQHSIDATLNVQ
jgi:hypothetical protein